jgi:hypothetical protein
MSSEETSCGEKPELCTAAIVVWHSWRSVETTGKEAWVATLRTKAEQARRIETFRTELHRIVGAREDITLRINGGCVEAEIEDLRFVALEYPATKTEAHPMSVTLLGRCPWCGVETMSEPFYNLAGLGKQLESFVPSHRHFCSLRPRSKAGE